MRDPSDMTQSPIQQEFPVKSVGVRRTKIICNQTVMTSAHLSQNIIIEILRNPETGTAALGTMIYVGDFARGPITKCSKFSQDAATQLRVKSPSVSLVNISFLFC